MSTPVWLMVPTPGHLRVRVTIQGRHTDVDTGAVSWVDTSSEIMEKGNLTQRLVYGSQRLVVEEIE